MRIALVSARFEETYRSLKYEETGARVDEFLSEADELRARDIAQGSVGLAEADAFCEYVLLNYPCWEPVWDIDGKRIGVQYLPGDRL